MAPFVHKLVKFTRGLWQNDSKTLKSRNTELSALKLQKSQLSHKLKKTRESLSMANTAILKNNSTTQMHVSAAICRKKESERSHFLFEKIMNR